MSIYLKIKTRLQNWRSDLSFEPIKTFVKQSPLLALWLLWLWIQSLWACFLNLWEIGFFYFGLFLAFGRLITEPTVGRFNRRLFFWLKVSFLFTLGRFLIFLYGNAPLFLFQIISPTQLLATLLPLAIEAGFIPGLKRQRRTYSKQPKPGEQNVLIDTKTGEIVKEMN